MDIAAKGKIERAFRQLYVASSYYAIKKMESKKIIKESAQS
jgi:hypothetical protein